VIMSALRRTPTGKLEVAWAKSVVQENAQS
jgi:hypothetical protein